MIGLRQPGKGFSNSYEASYGFACQGDSGTSSVMIYDANHNTYQVQNNAVYKDTDVFEVRTSGNSWITWFINGNQVYKYFTPVGVKDFYLQAAIYNTQPDAINNLQWIAESQAMTVPVVWSGVASSIDASVPGVLTKTTNDHNWGNSLYTEPIITADSSIRGVRFKCRDNGVAGSQGPSGWKMFGLKSDAHKGVTTTTLSYHNVVTFGVACHGGSGHNGGATQQVCLDGAPEVCYNTATMIGEDGTSGVKYGGVLFEVRVQPSGEQMLVSWYMDGVLFEEASYSVQFPLRIAGDLYSVQESSIYDISYVY